MIDARILKLCDGIQLSKEETLTILEKLLTLKGSEVILEESERFKKEFVALKTAYDNLVKEE